MATETHYALNFLSLQWWLLRMMAPATATGERVPVQRDQGVEVLHVVLHLELLGAVVLSVMPYRRLLVALFHPCRPR